LDLKNTAQSFKLQVNIDCAPSSPWPLACT
jgi:hypothetical protein